MKIGKELIGTLSPLAGMVTGKGLFGNAVGILPAIAKDIRDQKEDDRDKKKERAAEMAKVSAAINRPTTAALMAPKMPMMKKGGAVKKMAAGGSASKRADGCAQRGKTKGRMI